MFTFREMFASLAPFFNFREMFASLAPFFNFTKMFTSLAPFFTAAVVIVLTPFVKEHIPLAVSDYLVSMYEKWLSRLSTPRVTVIIDEFGDHYASNQVYEAARVHLLNLISISTNPKRFKVKKEGRQNDLIIDIVEDEEVIEIVDGISYNWKLRTVRRKDYECNSTQKYFELSFDKGLENEVLKSYLRRIVGHYEKMVKIYSRDGSSYDSTVAYGSFDRGWIYAIFEHPFTFEKLAMDPDQKKMLIADLDRFLGRKGLYEDVGKTWKRGYLLYGPPGTGKSRLIAAMANYLKFDIYDLNLSSRLTDVGLRNMLLSTTNRSILVIEDIDYGAELDDQRRDFYSDSILYSHKILF